MFVLRVAHLVRQVRPNFETTVIARTPPVTYKFLCALGGRQGKWCGASCSGRSRPSNIHGSDVEVVKGNLYLPVCDLRG